LHAGAHLSVGTSEEQTKSFGINEVLSVIKLELPWVSHPDWTDP